MFGTKHSKILNKWTEYQILELKYGNTKLLGSTKYNLVKLVFAVLPLLVWTKLALNYTKQAWYN